MSPTRPPTTDTETQALAFLADVRRNLTGKTILFRGTPLIADGQLEAIEAASKVQYSGMDAPTQMLYLKGFERAAKHLQKRTLTAYYPAILKTLMAELKDNTDRLQAMNSDTPALNPIELLPCTVKYGAIAKSLADEFPGFTDTSYIKALIKNRANPREQLQATQATWDKLLAHFPDRENYPAEKLRSHAMMHVRKGKNADADDVLFAKVGEAVASESASSRFNETNMEAALTSARSAILEERALPPKKRNGRAEADATPNAFVHALLLQGDAQAIAAVCKRVNTKLTAQLTGNAKGWQERAGRDKTQKGKS